MVCEHQSSSAVVGVRQCEICKRGPAGALLSCDKVLSVLSVNSSISEDRSRLLVRLFRPGVVTGMCSRLERVGQCSQWYESIREWYESI